MGTSKTKQATEKKSPSKPKQPVKKGKADAETVETPKLKRKAEEMPKDIKSQSKKKQVPPSSTNDDAHPTRPSAASVRKPETSELEKKRLQVADELRKLEQQIYSLETNYLNQSSAFGNAIRGYEGFLGGVAQANRKIVIKPEERLFTLSSASFVPQT